MSVQIDPTDDPGGLRGFISGHRRLVTWAVATGLVLATAGFLWFRPDKLFTDDEINEALPAVVSQQNPDPAETQTAAQESSADRARSRKKSKKKADTTEAAPVDGSDPMESGAAATEPVQETATDDSKTKSEQAEPKPLSSGRFRSLEHATSGTALIYETKDGLLLRLEDLDTSNGPDLYVMLSATPSTNDEWGAYDDGDHVLLAPLKANKGNQNYKIPNDLDLSRFKSVVIWCRRFTVGFGVAPMSL